MTRSVVQFGHDDCLTLVKVLDDTDLSHLKRLSLSCLKTKISDEGFVEVINRLSKIKTLEDVHVNVGQTALTTSVIDPLHSFIADTKEHLKKFDVSFMWCQQIDAEKKSAFKKLIVEEAQHLEEVGFDMVRTKRIPKAPTPQDIQEAKDKVEKVTH